ncbi:hypothetical protein TNCV_1046261 [Trichonephila clavipes]|nr:hypothetical protein TNCV_1046261 [Trichonephila clavipes]
MGNLPKHRVTLDRSFFSCGIDYTGPVLIKCYKVTEELPSTSNHRDRWELLHNIKRGFWKKWSSDFFSSLQPCKKWQDTQPNLKEDEIVLIKRRVILVHRQMLEFLKCLQASTD